MRDLTAAVQAALDAGTVYPVIFYEGEFSTGTLNLWSGTGTVEWDGKTWVGAGNLASVSEIQESAKVTAQGVTVSLSGMPSDIISKALAAARHGKPGRLWQGFLTSAGAIIADPYLSFEGRLDVPEIEDSGDTCKVSIAYESRLVDLLRPRVWRYTPESQKALYPDDQFFDYVPGMQNQELQW